jgi:hypothetical protein
MTKKQRKPPGEMTLDELDAMLAPATAKVIAEAFAEGFPIIHGDDKHVYREWSDGRIEIIHVHAKPQAKP